MASYTPNYNLKKPAGTDVVDIADLNGNMDIIDTQLNSLNSKFENDKIEYTDRNKGPYYCLVDIWTTLIPADNKVHFIILKAQYGDCFGFISRYGNYGTAMLLRYDGKALFEFLDNGTIIEKQPVWE